MNGGQASDDPGLQKSAYLHKPGKCPPVVRNPERRACSTKCFHHPDTLSVIHCHRLFDQARLASASNFQRELTMARGWSRHVHRIDFRIVNELLGLRVYAWDVVAGGEVLGSFPIASHDGDPSLSVRLLESGAALDLSYIAATNH